MSTSREIHLVRRPNGMPTTDDFALVTRDIPDVGDNEIQIQALWISVDPYMRPRLGGDQPLNAAMPGGAIGRVTQSNHASFRIGDIVQHGGGFRDRFNSDGVGVRVLSPDPALALSVYLHALGGTGVTAYGGLLEIGALKDGEQVLISTAGGAVGSVAAQIAKLKGCTVIGTTGSDDKVAWLKDVAKLDEVLNYKVEGFAKALADATPKGVDVYFENVGGAQLDAALPRMNVWGRIPVCGMISTYNGGGEGVRNLSNLIYKRVRMQGFVATDFASLTPKFVADMTGWLKAGQIKYQETVLEGFERIPEGLIGLFEGRNSGKMLIHVGEYPSASASGF